LGSRSTIRTIVNYLRQNAAREDTTSCEGLACQPKVS
jgi:hypothetical protein